MAAFEEARRQGAHAIETDVRLCATGEVVVFHDPDLTRMTGGADTRPVARVPLWDLRRIAIGSAGERAPALGELIAWSRDHGMPLNVEMKHDVPSRMGLARALGRALRGVTVPVLVSSFDPFTLAALAACSPRTALALLTDPQQSYAWTFHDLARVAGRAKALAALHVHDAQAHRDAVASWKRAGLDVGVWTVNDGTRARDLVSRGVDFLITDQPAQVLASLE